MEVPNLFLSLGAIQPRYAPEARGWLIALRSHWVVLDQSQKLYIYTVSKELWSLIQEKLDLQTTGLHN